MATNFLYATGTNGYIVTVDLLSTELNTWANNAVILSTVAGTAGVLAQTGTGSGFLAELWYTNGTATTTPTAAAGPTITGWFIRSPTGSVFEPATAILPRNPDFIINLPTAALVAGQIFYAPGIIRVPPGSFKSLAANLSGVALTGTGNKLTLGIVAVQY